MRKVIVAVFVFFSYFFTVQALADTENSEVSNAGVMWGKALESRQPQSIADLYSKEAYLYPTFENIKDSHKTILDYFVQLTKNDALKVVFNQQHIQLFGNIAVNSGFYTFSYKKEGKVVTVPARYTFVYLHEGNKWLIVNHHSSVLPKS